MRPRVVDLLAPLLGDRLAWFVAPRGTTLLLAAICVVLWVMIVRGRRVGLAPWQVTGAAAAGVAGGLIGARLFFLIQHAGQVASLPRALLDGCGGTTSWGGYLLGTAAWAGWLRWRGQPAWRHADVLASALGLGPAIARWGCLMSGCCWGAQAGVPWAVRFPAGSFAHAAHVRAGLIEPAAPLTLPVHPVQVYAALAGLVLFVAVTLVWRRARARPGVTFASFWLLYGALRFGTEFFRGDVPRPGPFGLTQSQVFALVVAVAAGALLRHRLRRAKS